MLPTPNIEAEREKRAEQYVYLCELADYLGRERSTLKRKYGSRGIAIITIRHPESGQMINAVSAEDAKRIIEAERQTPDVTIIKPEDLLKG